MQFSPDDGRIRAEAGPDTARAIRVLWDQLRHLMATVKADANSEAWISVPHSAVTFTASAGSWTVASGDLNFYKYVRIGRVVVIKGSIGTSSVSATPTELRLTPPPGVRFAGNDSIGLTIYTNDSFATQDLGHAIARVTNQWIALKTRTGAAWATTTDTTAVNFTVVAEVAP